MCFHNNTKLTLEYIDEKKENQFVFDEWIKFMTDGKFRHYYEVRRAIFGLGALIEFRDLSSF
jgi:hypothetical protein